MKEKIKYHGMKITVVQLRGYEIIDDMTLCSTYDNPFTQDNQIDGRALVKSNAVGDKVKRHPGRYYFRVISKFVKPEML